MDPSVGERLVQLAAGVYIEEDTLRIVQAIQEYDPNLVVKYLDPDRGGELDDPPFKLYERCPDGFERLVFGVWSLDERVLERLHSADTHRHDIMAQLEAHNAKKKEDDRRRYREEVIGEAHDIAIHVLRSPKSSYTVPHGVDGVKLVFDSTDLIKRKTKSGLEAKHFDLME